MTPTVIAYSMGSLGGMLLVGFWERGYMKTAIAVLVFMPLASTFLEQLAR